LGLRTVLRFEPWVPAGVVRVAPVLPPAVRRLRVDDIPLLGGRISVAVDGDDVTVDGLPRGVELRREPRSAVGGLGGLHSRV
ncbi:MAG: hypothetical protein ACRD0G_20905, partial [Acidimicrobiales bacterium]